MVFGGFASHSLASRIEDATPKVVVSADAGSRGGKVVPYKPLLDEALQLSAHKVERVLMVNRGLAEFAKVDAGAAASTQSLVAAAADRGPLASIGVDTWGLDYGLLDASGELVAPPHSYRDERLADWWRIAERIGPRRIYDIAGIQLMPGNGLFQLALHDREELDRARHVLLLEPVSSRLPARPVDAAASGASAAGRHHKPASSVTVTPSGVQP